MFQKPRQMRQDGRCLAGCRHRTRRNRRRSQIRDDSVGQVAVAVTAIPPFALGRRDLGCNRIGEQALCVGAEQGVVTWRCS